jgi:hypothetical protein
MDMTKLASKKFVCEYCKKSYSKESTLIVHMCEPKRRWLQKDEKRVKLGLYAFQRFYKLSAGNKTDKTYAEFTKSTFYKAFVKFGSFVNNVKPLYPEKYVDYVVTSGVKLDHWCKDAMYEEYAANLIIKEGVETALERSVNTMVAWAEANQSVWNHYFTYVSTNRAVYDIKDGKISPWLLLNCNSGKALLAKFNDEQLGLVFHILNPSHWAMRFKRQPSDVALVKSVAKQGNL